MKPSGTSNYVLIPLKYVTLYLNLKFTSSLQQDGDLRITSTKSNVMANCLADRWSDALAKPLHVAER